MLLDKIIGTIYINFTMQIVLDVQYTICNF